MPKHMAWTITGNLILTAHDEGPPGDDEWRAWLRDFERSAPELRGNVVYSLGGGPTSSQRKDLLNAISRLERVPPTVIMTSSALMRGLVTAIGWFLTADRRPTMFSLDEMGPALDSLSVDPATRLAARTEIERLRASLAGQPKATMSGRV